MEKIKQNNKPDRSLKTLFRTLKALRLPWIWIIAGLSLNMWLNSVLLKIPDLTANLTSGKITGGAVVSAIMYYVMYGALTVVATAGQVQAQTYSVKRARDTLWKKMLHTESGYFDRNNPQDIMSTVSNDTNSAVFNFVNLFIRLLPDIYYIYGAAKRINEYDTLLIVSCFALVPLKYLCSFIFGRLSQKTNASLYEKIGSLTGYLSDRLANLSLIKTYTNEEREKENGKRTSEKLYKANMKLTVLDNYILAFTSVLDVLQKITVVLVAVVLLQRGRIDMTVWLAFFLFTQNLFLYIDDIFDIWVRFKAMHGSFERVIDVMESESEPDARKDAFPKSGDVRFENVTFTYPETSVPALKNLSFRIPRGSSCAIIGLCGSGKTTTVSLLERLYTPDNGTIMLGETDINDITLSEYRQNIAYVQQGAGAFSGTVREAVTYGISRDVSDEEIFDAAKKTGLDEYLKIAPKGLCTEISASGASLSGGQMQRISITRELLRGGDIVIMDEPTSALDARISAKIQQTTDKLFENKTRILITHDLSFAAKYDKIIVLKDGEKVGEGTHKTLLESCDVYKEMLNNNCEEATV